MKVEPTEYKVTFDDGKIFLISRAPIGNWRIFSTMPDSTFNKFRTFEEALEALKKWKESKDER